MSWVEPPLATVLVFLAIVAAVASFWVIAARAVEPRWTAPAAVAVVVWLALTGVPVALGVFPRVDIPPTVIGFAAGSNLMMLALALSSMGRRIAELPVAWLIIPHALRLPLEIVLHSWFDAGTIPVQMTFEGHNFDIVTGALALLIGGYGLWRPLPKPAVWLFNLVGFALLLAVGAIALRSAPSPMNGYGPPYLLLPFQFPEAWIVPMCVAPALFGHVVLFRKLLSRSQTTVPASDIDQDATAG